LERSHVLAGFMVGSHSFPASIFPPGAIVPGPQIEHRNRIFSFVEFLGNAYAYIGKKNLLHFLHGEKYSSESGNGEDNMRKSIIWIVSIIFAMASFAVFAGPRQKGKRGGKGPKVHDAKEHGKKGWRKEHPGKGKGKAIGRKERDERRGKIRRKRGRMKGIQRKLERLRFIADRLEKRGKTKQAERIRKRIRLAEEKMAKKKRKIDADEEEIKKLPPPPPE